MPRIVTDPVPSDKVDRYYVDLNGTVTVVDATVQGEMVRLEYDLENDLPMGDHIVQIAAGGWWGIGEYSDPFLFTKELPGVPSGIALERS